MRHSDIFDDLPGTIARIARHLDLPAPDAAVEASVREHLDAGLRHHDAATASPDLDNPLLDLAQAIWNGGEIDLARLGPIVADLIGRGWLRPPVDGELLARARADVVKARETLRKTNRRVAMLEESPTECARADSPRPPPPPLTTDPRGTGRGRVSCSSRATSAAKYSQSSRRSASVSGRRPGSVDALLLVAEAHPVELRGHEVGRRADVPQGGVVHAARVVVDVVVEHHEESVAEAFVVRLEARRRTSRR